MLEVSNVGHSTVPMIDENLIRNELTVLERGEQLARRKEIYEAKHPQTKKGGDHKSDDANPGGRRPARPARDGDSARQAHLELTARLRAAGLGLKAAAESAVRDLERGEPGDWLGLRLRKGPGGLEALPADRCWHRLDEALELAHTKPAAPLRAREAIAAWAEQLGPCRPHLDLADFMARVGTAARRHAFDESPTRRALEDALLRGYRRWAILRGRARRQWTAASMTAAPPARV